MQYLNYIKKNNPIIFSIFRNAYHRQSFSHAYIFAGAKETKIDNEPLFLAQVLISEDPFNGQVRDPLKYVDCNVIGGDEGVIKKEVVSNAINQLHESSLEHNPRKILIIKNLENANVQSFNSLLKFLEDPPPHTFLIFTTNNLSGIVKTIRSRTQVINVKTPSQTQVVNDFVSQGIEHQNARLLSDFTTDLKLAMLWNNEFLAITKQKLLSVLAVALSQKEIVYTEFFKLITLELTPLVLNLLCSFFNDIWRFRSGLKTAFTNTKLIEQYSDLDFNYKAALIIINTFWGEIKINVNFDLAKSEFLLALKGLYG